MACHLFQMKEIRTRIAPSPTGDPHVGTAYIALFNRCFAHQNNGKFILRIEDTDKARSSNKSEQDILKALKWLGLSWDEGIDKDGDYGPYRQSERSSIYSEHTEILLRNGKAFHCFCSSQRLNEIRRLQMEGNKQPGYDGHCLKLTKEEIQTKLVAGDEYVIRMKIPEFGECIFHDLLRGEVKISWNQVDMQVLLKSDGLPTYHFANVVDDHLMAISHVIRGEEWINSVPKHVLLYKYFGWEPPVFCHMPLLRNPDKSKLSKRKNPTSINYFRDMGYLPQALVNYLGMMGWSMTSGEEKFTLAQMTEALDLNRISLGGPIFDVEKLNWLNGKYIREDLSDSEFITEFTNWAFNLEKIEAIIPLVKQRVERFSDVANLSQFFFSARVDITDKSFEHKKLDADSSLKIIQFTLWRLESINSWKRDEIEMALQELAMLLEYKIRDFLFPLFIAITGKSVSISVIDSIYILGIDLTRARLRDAISALGGIPNKTVKSWEKQFKQSL